jgi:hypothetical protein
VLVERFPDDAACGAYLERLWWPLGTKHRVAWAMVQRYRVATVRSERDRLTGAVEVDETSVGGVEHGGKRGRGLVFRRLLEQAVVTGPVTEADVTHGYDW